MLNKSLPQYLKRITTLKLTILVSLYYLFGLNFALIKKLYIILAEQADIGMVFALTMPIFFMTVFVFFFTPFITKYIAKPFLILMIITSACVNYGAYNFGIIFNQDMMVNIFETTTSEATDYLNIKLIIWLFLSAGLPCLYIAFVKIEYKRFSKELLQKTGLMLLCIIILIAIAAFAYKDYASIARNNPKIQKDIVPFYYISNTIKYFKSTYFKKDMPYQVLGQDALRTKTDDKEKYLLVVLVGETARAQNYQVNGYERETNPHTQNIKNIVSFKNVTSCGTATAISLPCMFSLLGKDKYSREAFDHQDNVVDIIKKAGYSQVWVDNNTGCKGVCTNIEQKRPDDFVNIECDGEECTDSVLIEALPETIKNMQGKDGVIYLHLIGSHGPTYYKRYPREHAFFQPDCQTSDLQNCTREEILNSYDNTIRYTDYVMAQAISEIKKYNDIYHTSLIYLSDHGESLGENGLYLHGMPYKIAPKEQTHIPFMIWFSEKMLKHESLDMNCLKKRADETFISHDYLSSTLLEILDIETKDYDSKKDLIRACSQEGELE